MRWVRRIAVWSMLAGLLLVAAPGAAALLVERQPGLETPVLALTDAQGEYAPGLYAGYLEDLTGVLTFADVSAPDYASRFTPSQRRTPNFGLTRSVYWLRIPLRNASSTTQWLLEISPPYLDAVDVYLQADGRTSHAHAGDLQPFHQRPIPYRHFLVALSLPLQAEQTLYMRLQNKDHLFVALTLWNPAALVAAPPFQSVEMGFLYGAILIITGYNALLFLRLRERIYLYFACYAAAHVLLYIAEAGLGYQYLWPRAVGWQNVAVITFWLLTAIAHLLFTLQFLQLRRYSLPLAHLLYVGLGVAVLLMLGSLLTDVMFFRQSVTLLGGPTALLFLGIGIYAWARGVPLARYYLFIWGVYGLGVLVNVLALLDVLPITPLTLHIDAYAFVLMLLLLSLTLADRIHLTEREKEIAQARALELAQENERLVREQNVRLEQAVAARTAALRESEERFATVLNGMDAFVYVAAMDTYEILFINQRARSLFGDVVGQTCWQALQVGQNGPCAFCTNRYLLDEDGQPTGSYIWEFQNTRTGCWYHIQNQAIRWTDGRMVRLEVASDITRVKESEAQRQRLAVLEERERIGQDLHDDLGQIMGYIAVQAQAIQEHLGDIEPGLMRAMLVRVQQAAQKAHADLRTYILGIRSQAASPTTDFVAALKVYCQEMLSQYGLDVQLSLPDALQTVALPPQVETQLLRIVQEALINVRKHAGVQTARITVTLHPDEVQVMIADDGVGFRASPSLPDPIQAAETGAGFGLDIMRKRVDSVGGSLEVRSAPGAGTQVIVRVPCGAPAIVLDEKPWQSWRVLLADDHALFLEGLRNLFGSRGVQVVGMARNGEEAQALARTTRPDLILMDVHMPVCDGLEATRRIHADLPGVKIVMLTVEADDDALFTALKAGASGYLLKALQSELFFELLAQVMQGEVTLSPGLASRVLTEFVQHLQTVTPPVGRKVSSSFTALTERQVEILDLIARGLTYKEVGQRLYLSERTIRYHMGQILEGLQLENRRAAVVYARQKGLGMSG